MEVPGSQLASKKRRIQGYMVGNSSVPIHSEIIKRDMEDLEMDFELANSGVQLIKRQPITPIHQMIQIVDEKHRFLECINVAGIFPLIGPWWHITFSLSYRGRVSYLDGIPSYRLCSERLKRKTVFLRFLGMCDIAKVYRTVLESHTNSLDREDYSHLFDKQGLTEMIVECANNQTTVSMREKLLSLIPVLTESTMMGEIQAAKDCPAVMKILPLLLPDMFYTIVRHGIRKHGGKNFLSTLEDIIVNSVWELAFSKLNAEKTMAFLPEVCIDQFEKADLWSNLTQPYKDAVMMYTVLKKFYSTTHDTYMRTKNLCDDRYRYGHHQLQHFQKAKEFMKAVGLIVEENDRIFLKTLYDAEKNICDTFARMLTSPSGLIFPLDFSEEPLKALVLDPDQVDAVKLLSKMPVVVLCGPAGSGKTEVVTRFCKVAVEEIYKRNKSHSSQSAVHLYGEPSCTESANRAHMFHSTPVEHSSGGQDTASLDKSKSRYILATAATSKSAKALQSRGGYKGYTVHQVIWHHLNSRKYGLRPPFTETSILIVDECSLVSVLDLSALLRIMESQAQLQQIILLGDEHQLPSIRPGKLLADVAKSLSNWGAAIELRKNHRSTGRLIAENSIRINSGQFPEFDLNTFSKLEVIEEDHLEQALHKLVSTGFKNDRDSQFVTFLRKDCEVINSICSKLYIGDSLAKSSGATFMRGSKICCTRAGMVDALVVCDLWNAPANYQSNAWQEEDGEELDESFIVGSAFTPFQSWLEDHIQSFIVQQTSRSFSTNSFSSSVKSPSHVHEPSHVREPFREKRVRLCTGDTFWISEVYTDPHAQTPQEYWLLESDGDLIIVVSRVALMEACAMRPSWCRTLHTYQGSEIAHVGFYVGSSNRQNRQHIYTAVTRGKSSVTIIGSIKNLHSAIQRSPAPRYSSLSERLNRLRLTPSKSTPNSERATPVSPTKRRLFGLSAHDGSTEDTSHVGATSAQEDYTEDTWQGEVEDEGTPTKQFSPLSVIGAYESTPVYTSLRQPTSVRRAVFSLACLDSPQSDQQDSSDESLQFDCLF